jgi:tRNA-Thr(GGU) m(6)t(6)A37 methyltransferase TsaA
MPIDDKMIMTLTPIGVIHSPFQHATGTPLQPFCAKGVQGSIEVYEPFVEGLRDLEGFERIWVVFWCHRASAAKLTVTPYRDSVAHGLFATRAPARPNPIGLSTVRLRKVAGNMVQVEELDILDGTPVLDIKPYVSQYDSYPAQRCGWLENGTVRRDIVQADDRFERASAARRP